MYLPQAAHAPRLVGLVRPHRMRLRHLKVYYIPTYSHSNILCIFWEIESSKLNTVNSSKNRVSYCTSLFQKRREFLFNLIGQRKFSL